MDFLSGMFSGFGGAVLATVKTAGPALLVGAFIKHGDKVPLLGAATRLIPNGAIPAVLPFVGAAVAGDPVIGMAGAAGATWAQQLLKIGLRTAVEKFSLAGGSVQRAVGPGVRLSI